MKKMITYTVSYSYNQGMMGAQKTFGTYDEAKAFAVEYMKNIEDTEKFYKITRNEIRKVLGFVVSNEVWNLEEESEK